MQLKFKCISKKESTAHPNLIEITFEPVPDENYGQGEGPFVVRIYGNPAQSYLIGETYQISAYAYYGNSETAEQA